MKWSRLEQGAKIVLTAVFGLVIAGLSGVFLWIEMQRPESHSGHVYIFAGGIFLGALIIAPTLIMSRVKQVIVLLPEIRIGGKRYSDPPKPEE